MGNILISQKEAQMISRYVSFSEGMDAADIVCGCKDYKGNSILKRYIDQPRALIAIAYMIGVAEGKRRERERRRNAAIKKRIRETGELPME